MVKALILASFVLLGGGAQQLIDRTFDADGSGTPPGRFLFAVGRDGVPGRWFVQRETANQVLAHLGQPGAPNGFAVAIQDPEQYEDVEVSVRLRAGGGSRTAGLVWKYSDPLNHNVVQLNLVSQELAVYRVALGNRIRIDREDDLELDADAWHTLRLVQDESTLRVYLGGIPVFRERSRAIRGMGGVGLWAASDAVVSFDDFRIEARTGRDR